MQGLLTHAEKERGFLRELQVSAVTEPEKGGRPESGSDCCLNSRTPAANTTLENKAWGGDSAGSREFRSRSSFALCQRLEDFHQPPPPPTPSTGVVCF